jgi:hypothetical protein
MSRIRRAVGLGLGRHVWMTALTVVGLSTPVPAGQQPAPTQATGTGVTAGRVVDAVSGEPLADATVDVGAASPSWPRLDVLTDAQGRLEIRDQPAGSLLLLEFRPVKIIRF